MGSTIIQSVTPPVEALMQVGPDDWLRFRDPARVIQASQPADVAPALTEVERLTRDFGYHAVGFLTYEAGAAYGLAVAGEPADSLPLVWFACFDASHVAASPPPVPQAPYEIGPLGPSVDRRAFGEVFDRIKNHIAEGDTYQVNYTFRLEGSFAGDARALFADLMEAQGGRWGAFIDLGTHSICSASPELFFSCAGSTLAVRPMKGTARRGRTLEEDRQQSAALHASEKQRAENVMIVDMVRNDLGRIAEVGSVEVPEFLALERYPNLWQMTSLVTARSFAAIDQIFAALHPAASVTGAPKVRTMEILSALERQQRGLYTGAIGHIPPDGNACFNVAIRTAVVDHQAQRVSFGVGSGIVWDSDVDAEYAECLLKGSILGRKARRFDLLETLRWTPEGGYLLLNRHLDRLRDSAEYFGFAFDRNRVITALDEATAREDRSLRIRVLLARSGDVSIESDVFQPGPEPVTLQLADGPVDSSDVMLFHKTTDRVTYERARRIGCDDVVLWNEHGQVTETTTANIVLEIDGMKVTPSLASGLLAGTYRAEMLANGEARERTVMIDDLWRAERIWVVNSVQGSRLAIVERRSPESGDV